MHLWLLGEMKVFWQGQPLAVSAPRMLGVLAYLHLNGPTPRSELQAVFWPGQGAGAVRQALYILRGLPDASEWLVDGQVLVELRASSDLGLARQAADAREYAQAARLLRAEPLLGHLKIQHAPAFDDWLEEERRLSRQTHTEVLRAYAQYLLRQRDHAAARLVLTALLELEPLEESAYQSLMRLEHAQGRTDEALAVFEGLRRTLHRELQVEPSAETLQLLHEIEGQNLPTQTRARLLTPPQEAVPGGETCWGREEELAAIARHLQEDQPPRLLLQGLAGLGKTRLAWAAAEQVLQTGQAVAWLELGGEPAETLLWALAEVFELHDPGLPQLPGLLAEHFRRHKVGLLVLDNVANTYAAGILLRALPPDIPVLLTSRLRLPQLRHHTLGRLPREASLSLLRSFQPQAPQDDKLGELCAMLGDHPYALRLAALTLQQGHLRAAELLAALQGAPHMLGEDHSVQVLLEHSVSFLTTPAYEAYLGLGSLFTSQVTPELLALALRRRPDDTESALYMLVEHGLATREARQGSEQVSFRMHDLTWHHARSFRMLQPRTVLQAVCDFAASKKGQADALWSDLENLISAAQYAAQQHPGALIPLFKGWLGGPYIAARGFPLAYLGLLQQAVELASAQQDWAAVSLLAGKLGDIHQAILDHPAEATAHYLRAAEAAGKAGLVVDQVVRLSIAGTLQAIQHRAEASDTLSRARRLAETTGDPLCLTRVMNQQGVYAAMQQQYQEAYDVLLDARKRLEPLLMPESEHLGAAQVQMNNICSNLGQACKRLGRMAEALAHYQTGLELARTRQETYWEADTLAEMGEVYVQQGKPAQARQAWQRAAELFDGLGVEKRHQALLEALNTLTA